MISLKNKKLLNHHRLKSILKSKKKFLYPRLWRQLKGSRRKRRSRALQ